MYLERVTLILEIIGQKGEATVADICAHSDLPKASAYRLVQDLVAVGLIEPVANGRFSVGSRLKRVLLTDQSDPALVEIIGPLLKQAASDKGVAFFLARLRGRAVEIIHVETPENGVSYLHPGLGKRPLHACSCGKAIVAFNNDLDLSAEIEKRLKAYTEFTLMSIDDLATELQAIRQSGYAECVEELERGMCSVAAPLPTSGVPGLDATIAIGATGPVRVFTPKFRADIGAACIRLAKAASDKLQGAEAGEGVVSAAS